MKRPLTPIGLRFSMIHALVAAAVVPFLIVMTIRTRYQWWGIGLAVVVVIAVLVTFRGRRLSEWTAALFAWLARHRRRPPRPSEPVVGATVMPADHVAVRWHDDCLVALIKLVPRPFTPSVVVDGSLLTDDVIDTRLIEHLLSVHCPDLDADVVSAGYRMGAAAPSDVRARYEQEIGSDPAPAYRRTWIAVTADPLRAEASAQRRDAGVAGLIRYLVASTTRIADNLAAHGVDAHCERSFDDYDRVTDIHVERETWSRVKGRDGYTAAYTAAGGPDVWWAAAADRTITRVRVSHGQVPRSTVLLTTRGKAKRPSGFTPVSGGQRAALRGPGVISDRHHQIPIGSAGVLVGETATGRRLYLPFDDVDVSLKVGDARTFTQFAVRAAAAGGVVTLQARFGEFAELIGAHIGAEAKVMWPHATTYLNQHPGVEQVVLRHDAISTPRHRQLAIRAKSLSDGRFEAALPR